MDPNGTWRDVVRYFARLLSCATWGIPDRGSKAEISMLITSQEGGKCVLSVPLPGSSHGCWAGHVNSSLFSETHLKKKNDQRRAAFPKLGALSFHKRTNVPQVSSVNQGCVNQAASVPEVALWQWQRGDRSHLVVRALAAQLSWGSKDKSMKSTRAFIYRESKTIILHRNFSQACRISHKSPMDCDNIASVRVYSYITLICLTIEVEARRTQRITISMYECCCVACVGHLARDGV